MNIDTPWPYMGSHLELIDFEESKAPSWAVYLDDKREYWGEDRISGSRSADWAWEGDEQKWIEMTKQDYDKYVLYCAKWLGKFNRNQVIEIQQTEKKGVIKLCVVKDGATTWGDTVEFWLMREIGIFPPKSTLLAQIYTFSTTVKANGDPTSSWLKATLKVRLDNKNSSLSIGGAHFKILNMGK